MSVDFFDENSENTKKKTPKGENKTPVLDNFSSDLTKLAKEKKLDEVVGRDVEVKRMIQILSRKKKRNVIMVGLPGVGKSALVEKLALMIERGDCPSELVDKRVVSLDITSIVAGTKYRGQFEERMKTIINEVKSVSNVILFIDEIHMMMGAGNSNGGMDVANILKPALARGELQCIGATTLDEYKKHLEKDSALERRFGKIILAEPTKTETVEILTRIRNNYENYHNVVYSDEVIKTIVELSGHYITDKYFPDKAIDVMDELGSEKKINLKVPDVIDELSRKLQSIKEKKIAVVAKQEYEEAAKLKKTETEISDKLITEKEKWKYERSVNKTEITVEDVFTLITEMTGIPVNQIDEKEREKLLNFEELLSAKVIGQKDAIMSLSKTIRRNRVGVRDMNRPQGVYFFVGGSGSGKTFLVKTLAELLFGNADKVLRFDMSEYMERHDISKLIGSSPGYVGHEEGGQLTEKVKNNPFSIILFDEIEKAHKDVYNLLLQVLDEGHLTDSFGRKVNFKNTIIIMTSNNGSQMANEFGGGIGFGSKDVSKNKKDIIKSELRKSFSPEFLNRLDDVIIFETLTEDELKQIAVLELNKMVKRLSFHNYKIKYDESIVEEVINRNKEEGYGARPIKRIIQNLCEDFIADEILRGNIKENKITTLTYKENIKIKGRK